MSLAAVSANQRPTRERPCEGCGGSASEPRGSGRRCAGFRSPDGGWMNCSRAEHAGNLVVNEKTSPPTYAHRLTGDCGCGNRHGGTGGSSDSRIVEVYPYPAEDGTLLYESVRKFPKEFFQRYHGGATGKTVRRVPYRLPELKAAPPSATVFVVEGERAVDFLRALGLVATTSVGGCGMGRGQWTAPAFVEPLRGRHVAVVADNDPPGRAHSEMVRRALEKVAATARIVELPGARPVGGGLDDWLADGHTVKELEALVAATSVATSPGTEPELEKDSLPLWAFEQAVVEWSKPQPSVISTGLPPLDELLGGGLESGSVYGLCAPTGMGKTGLAILIARTIAVEQTVVLFSSELPVRQVLSRVAAQILGTSWRDLNRLTATRGLPLISRALQGLRLRVVELGRDTDMVDVLSRIADRDGQAPVLFLDYLQHAARRVPIEDRRVAVATLSDTLTRWARDAKTRAVIISSVARAQYVRDENRSASSYVGSAKESGDVDFDCSAILFLDTIVDGVQPGGMTTARLHVAKSRFGTTGTVGLTFDGAIGLFTVDRAGTLTVSQQEIVDAVRDGATTAADVAREVGRRRADVLSTIAVLRTQGVLGTRPLRVVQQPSPESSRRVPTDGDDFAIFGATGTRNFRVPAGSRDGFSDGETGSGLGNPPQGGNFGSHPVGVDREPRPPEERETDLLDFETFEAGQ